MISTAPFDTYLEKNAARIWDMDVCYAGRCGGDVVIGAVDLAAIVKGLANLPGALEELLNGIGSLSGGSPQLQLVGGSAQAAADGSGVISGLAGIGWGSIPALLFGDAGEDFLNSFAKIDRDRLLGSEAEAYYKKGLKEIPDDWTEVEAPEEIKKVNFLKIICVNKAIILKIGKSSREMGFTRWNNISEELLDKWNRLLSW